MTNVSGLPEESGDLVFHADGKVEFAGLLREIAERSGLNGGQISMKAAIPRSTVYNILNPKNTAFIRSVDQVESFCQACKLTDEQVAKVVEIWNQLNGTSITVNSDEMVLDAELVDSANVSSRTSPTGMSGIDAGPALFGSNTVYIQNARGDVNITYDHSPPAEPNQLAAAQRLGDQINTAVVAIAVVITVIGILWLFDTSPYYVLALSRVLLALAVVAMVIGPAMFVLAKTVRGVVRDRKLRSGTEQKAISPPLTQSHAHLRRIDPRAWERTLSWPIVVVFAVAAGAGSVIGTGVTARTDVYVPHDLAVDTGVVSGILFGLVALMIVGFWAWTIDWLAIRLLFKHFPVLGVLMWFLGVVLNVVLNRAASLPVESAVVAAILILGSIVHSLDKLLAQNHKATWLADRARG